LEKKAKSKARRKAKKFYLNFGVEGYPPYNNPQTPLGWAGGKKTHGEWGKAGENKKGGFSPLKNFPKLF
jgi:hypothetical protein